jgi:hypothetical protein
MLKDNAKKLISTLDSLGLGGTRLVLAALMTHTLSRTNPVSDADTYLYRLCSYYEMLGDTNYLEKQFRRSKNFSDNGVD